MTDGVAIEVSGVRKRFGDVQALDGVDLQVAAGTVYGLLGPNGAGKTTMVRILTTIITPDAGSVRVLGMDVTTETKRVRASIGLAGQYAAVDEILTGRENLRLVGQLCHMPTKLVNQRADELLSLFALEHAADRSLKTYSGGMRRRLDLAASLVHRPPVLFLDEPTTGLDPQSRSDLWDLIRDLVADGTTLLLTTQYLEEADVLADRIAVIDRGHVIAEGTASELKTQMGATVLEVAFASRPAADVALGTIRGVLADAEVDGTTVRAAAPDGARSAMEVLRAIDAAGLEPGGLTVREPSLDDVFLTLTGHRTEEPDGGGPAGSDAANDGGAR
ncbi:MAG: ATP-binding cassette domain-containing protein [Acidimicrobiales bacterium]